MRARIATTATTVRNKVGRAAFADRCVRDWEIIADKLSKAGWSWGCISSIDSDGRTIWIADAHRDDGKRFVVRADEKLTAFCRTRPRRDLGWPH
jgi:hypothetical protein